MDELESIVDFLIRNLPEIVAGAAGLGIVAGAEPYVNRASARAEYELSAHRFRDRRIYTSKDQRRIEKASRTISKLQKSREHLSENQTRELDRYDSFVKAYQAGDTTLPPDLFPTVDHSTSYGQETVRSRMYDPRPVRTRTYHDKTVHRG